MQRAKKRKLQRIAESGKEPQKARAMRVYPNFVGYTNKDRELIKQEIITGKRKR